jgi:hypothetical protein
MKLTSGLMGGNNQSKKLSSMICDISMSPSIMIYRWIFIDGQSTPKKLYPLYSIGISIAEYNISLIEKLYAIPSVVFFVRWYIRR